MNIYLVERAGGSGAQEYKSFVVACFSEEQAREYHPELGLDAWQDGNFGNWPIDNRKTDLTITLLGETSPSIAQGILTTSINLG